MKPLVLAGRLIFGAWMLANGINHFFYPMWAEPIGHEPLAQQLMAALVHSRLFDVAMAIELVTGALILLGVLVPVALCVVMPISTCALYWSMILDHRPLGSLLAAAAFALNGLLMLAYLDHYRGVLQRHAVTFGETAVGRNSFDFLFVNPSGRTARSEFVQALLTLLIVTAFYAFVVRGLTSHWCLLVMVFPALVLHARRLHDMGRSAWLLLVPGTLTVAAFAIWLHLVNWGTQLNAGVTYAAFAVCAAFVVWASAGRGQAEANRFGSPVAA